MSVSGWKIIKEFLQLIVTLARIIQRHRSDQWSLDRNNSRSQPDKLPSVDGRFHSINLDKRIGGTRHMTIY